MTEGDAGQASSAGSPLHLNADDAYLRYDLPFDLNFGLFGRTYGTVFVSTNGALYFGQPPHDAQGPLSDASGSVSQLNGTAMIAGLWDDLRTDRRAGDDVYVSQPSPDKIVFRWQAVTFDTVLPDGTRRGENPVNFEIELDRDGRRVALSPGFIVARSEGENVPWLTAMP